MPPLMLCIDMDKARALRFSLAAMALGVRVKLIDKADNGQTLGALCGLEEGAPSPTARPVPEEMLLFAFVPEALFSRLLKALRETGLAPVRLKAVLTPHNRGWDCAALCAALRDEAAALGR